jgi:uncharacterized protein YndB with AHSA1/START domain
MSETELSISRRIAAPRAAVWAAWSEPGRLEEWFCPKPWRAEVRAFDLRPGGAFRTVMHGPEGERHDEGDGCFLEVVPQERIVFTSVLGEGFRPVIASNQGCDLPMTAIITLADDGAGTLYTARVLHANADDRRKHEEMGFEPGWGAAIAQLEEVARQLAAELA